MVTQRVLHVTGATIDNTVVISGLTLTGGNVFDSSGGILIDGGAQPLLQNLIIEDHNLYFNTTMATTGSMGHGGHSLSGDPQFIDPAGQDYRLGAGSAAIDRGLELGVPVDILGAARPQGGGVDIGAYEAQQVPILSLSKSVTAAQFPIRPGDPLTYTIILTNQGLAEAVDVHLTDTLPGPVNGPALDRRVTATVNSSSRYRNPRSWPSVPPCSVDGSKVSRT